MHADDGYAHRVVLGRAALNDARLTEAVRLLEQAVELSPHQADAYLHLGAALRGLGQAERARLAYARALATAPEGHATADAVDEGLRALRPVRTDRRERGNFRRGQLVESERNGPCTVLEVRKGGFGVVYVVRVESSGARMAFKTLDARLVWSDEDQDRFAREALTWVRLDPHPNVAQAEGVEWIEGMPCVITAYAEGGDLMHLLARSGPLMLRGALRHARQLCDGLRHAHEQLGIVHRDVKPANCLLDADGTLRVTDFGLARVFDGVHETGAAPGRGRSAPSPGTAALLTSVAGTPPYMAPEQFVPGAVLDTRADVYAFGVVLFQMITGRIPPGDGRARAHIDRATPRRERRTALYRLIRGCTAPDRADRPPDFAAVRELLDTAHRELTGAPSPAPARAQRARAEDRLSQALSLRHLGRNDEALAAVREGQELAERNRDGDVALGRLWQVRGMVLESLRRYDDALAAHDRAVELNPDEATAWLARGTVLRTLGRGDDAMESFDRTLALKPGEEFAWSNKAEVLGGLGRDEEAEEAFTRSLELNPRRHGVLCDRAELRHRAGRSTEALADLDRALEISPRDFGTLVAKAKLLRDLMHYTEALEVLRHAAEIEPDDPVLWGLRMHVHGELGQHEQALECMETALRQREALTGRDDGDQGRNSLGRAHLWRYRGTVLARLGRPSEDVLACCDRAVGLAPEVAEFRLHRAAVLGELGRIEEELADCEQAFALEPDEPRSWRRTANTLRRMGRMEDALAWCEEAVAAFPGHNGILNETCAALIGLGRLDDALLCAQEWRERHPMDADAWMQFSFVLWRLGRDEESLAWADEALETWPDEPYLWYRRGHALEPLGRTEEAAAALERSAALKNAD
ncbi:serine/threonine protein kinase [Murinocardiopsis flavida]|uniref:Serine/threonine protein kinase n=1 Tax=Murinocardiopsis flavida TaxID=645275 RepID=A0A2P8DIM7_9ACTN|nr:serine/threonine-protein kinase [Murinocardiopsis flavida]PSK97009.1 serine/threonine protein kinase [Murinocardiopsis flavida]